MGKLKYIVFLIFVVIFAGSLSNVSADSGWDSDYSSGSSWSGSSGWDSSSYSTWDYDNSRNSNSSHSSSNSKASAICFLIILSALILSAVFSIIRTLLLSIPKSSDSVRNKAPVVTLEESTFIHDYDDTVKKYFSQYTEKSLIEHLFKNFVDIQIAWMDFDYDSLKRLCTDQLYQSYRMDLEQLKSKHRQNIMHDFSLNAANIMEIVEEDNAIIIKLYMHAAFYDYVVDTDSNKVVRGKVNYLIHNQYNLEFVVTKNLLEKCPNCGKQLNGKNECEYCHSHINDNYSDFVLSKKEKI